MVDKVKHLRKMPGTKNILIICRDLRSASRLSRFKPQSQSRYILASDDLRVHEAAKEYLWIDEICWIEQIESYYCVADDVIAIIRQINKWLESFGREDEISKELLYWGMYCDGGDTSQRVLDLLLLMRSYQDLINRFQPGEIILIRSANASWEDELFLAFADDIGIRIRVSGRLDLAGWLRNRVWPKWRPLAVGVYWSAKIIQVKLANLFRMQPSVDAKKSVMVQLEGDSKKHLNHTQTLLKAINDSGLQGVALGWRLGQSANILRHEGIAVVELEMWLSLGDLVAGWFRTLKSWRRAKANIHNFLSDNQGIKKAGLLRGILSKSIRSFYLSELVGRYYLRKAARVFFQHNRPRALRPHSLVLPVGVIPYRAIKNIDEKIIVFIQGGWAYNVPEPISDFESPIPRDEVVFCSTGKLHRSILLDKGFLDKNVYITGLNWIEPITEFREKFSKIDSRKALGLNLQAELYVLYDPNSFLRGYLTRQERYLTLQSVMNIAKKHRDVQVMIKPHTSHKKGLLEKIVKQYSLQNVKLIEQSMLPYHALNAADILITKFSTLAIEGMFLGVPTLGVILDNEENFKYYDSAVEYHSSLISFESKLHMLIDDRGYRQKWLGEMKERQAEFFEKHGLVSSGSPATGVARIIRDLVNARNIQTLDDESRSISSFNL